MQGLIISNISNIYNVKVNDIIYKCNARGKFKNEDISPVVGDNVEILVTDEEKKEAVIENILDRKKYLKRPKIANITQIICVISSKNPKPDLLMLDKQLAYAEYIGITPIILVNKLDLNSDIEEIKEIYTKIGYKVILAVAKEKQGIEELKEVLKNNISAFSGNSGVGKSTLINGIFNSNISDEGLISEKNKKGKNTTTNISLYELEKDTYIADTPGFSTFDIYEIESEYLANYFVEFKEHISECEYIGCNHIKEEKCGIKEAVENGDISKDRYDRFIKIYNDIKDKEEHKW